MKRDTLNDLLIRADDRAGTPRFDAGELCETVFARADRCRRIRRAGASAIAIVLAAGATGYWLRETSTDRDSPIAFRSETEWPEARNHDDPKGLQREIRQLRAEADRRMRMAELLIQSRARSTRLSAYRKRAMISDPLMAVRREAEVAARIMVDHADRLSRRPHTQTSALRTWRRTIDLFPNTNSARIARRRISKTQDPQGDET